MIGQRDPDATIRWAITNTIRRLESGGSDEVSIPRADLEALLTGARAARLPDESATLVLRVLAGEDSARFWERKYRETAAELRNLQGVAEAGDHQSTRYT